MKQGVGVSYPKIDTKANVLGGAVYVDDYPKLPGTLYVKAVRSPYAQALIRSIDKKAAEKVPGVVAVFTYEDVPDIRYSANGGSYPEGQPYDRKILDRKVRYIGDEVALVAAETREAAEKASCLVKVQYEVLPAVFDARESGASGIVIHDENDLFAPVTPNKMDIAHNQINLYEVIKGDADREIAESEFVVSEHYSTQAQAHAMMETLRAYTFFADDGRLTVIATTQAPYHMRRQVARSLGLPVSQVHVIKKRVGGGFGGKKVAITEPLAAFVTLKTGRPASFVLTRQENFSTTTTRHAMDMDVTLGADGDGMLRGLRIDCTSNTGAYAEEGPVVTMVVANNILPSYNRTPGIYYAGRTFYTNIVSAAALRGYGATQGGFVLESAVNELCHKMGIDPCDFRLKNCVRVGDEGGILHSPVRSCALDECIRRGKELIDWDSKYPRQVISDTKVRAVGMAITTHRTSIPMADKATVTIRLEMDGTYLLLTGAADLGTGSDTILCQIAAEALQTDAGRIRIVSGDTDSGTYDAGAFASSTTYVAGNGVKKAAEEVICKIVELGAKMLGAEVDAVEFMGDGVRLRSDPSNFVSIEAIGTKADGPGTDVIIGSATFVSPGPPLTCSAGFVEIELDIETGKIEVIEFDLLADCGKVINPALARVQAEGGIMMGLGLALYEDVHYREDGKLQTDSFMQYKIPCREDINRMKLNVEFIETYEPSGPFGAKSIGEAIVHVAAPAIQGALINAAGIALRDLPFTPEKVWRAIRDKQMVD